MDKVNKDLTLDDGTTLKWFAKDHTHFLNKTTLIYGRTNSGKSVIIDEIMFLLKDHVPIPFVICESSVTITSSPYIDKLPNKCIKSGTTKEWLEKFISIQKGKAALFKTANDIKTIKKVFDKIKNSDCANTEQSIKQFSEKYIHNINNNNKLNFLEKKEQITNITNIQQTNLVDLYKKFIRKNKVELENNKSLSADEICCVNYLDFNPNILLIYDDCAANFKKWVKESTVIKEMFYNGRHYFITQIITAQDDKEIDSALRKNALVSIFTTQQSATANFERKSNSYPKTEIKKAEMCIKRIFNDDTKLNFQKLIYLQNGNASPFYYTIANIYDNWRVGCDALWELDQRITETSVSENTNNHFYNSYYNS